MENSIITIHLIIDDIIPQISHPVTVGASFSYTKHAPLDGQWDIRKTGDAFRESIIGYEVQPNFDSSK